MKLRPLITLFASLAIGASPALVNALTANDPDAIALLGAAQVSTTQQTSGTATLAAAALSKASGNIGLNIVSGVGNAQSNALAIH